MKSFSAAERQSRLLEFVRGRGRMSVADLIRESGASAATVRRDIGELVERGMLERVRGGVFWPGARGMGEEPHARRAAEATGEKEAIAREAVGMVVGRTSVYLDAGTTCLAVARLLVRRPDVLIFTNSLAVAGLVAEASARIVFLGGECRVVSLALVGSVAEAQSGWINPEIGFFGATGVHLKRGIFTTEPSEAGIKARMVDRVRQRVLVADSSKAGQTSAVRFAGWESMDTWVVDAGLGAARAKAYPVAVRRAALKARPGADS